MKFEFFNCDDFSELLKGYLTTQPQRGRGLVKQLAEELGVTSSHVSQFLSGNKNPNYDQVFRIGKYLKWIKLEVEFAQTLAEIQRSQYHEAKKELVEKKISLRMQAKKLSSRVDEARSLSMTEQAIFYSSWIYSALRLSCSLGRGKSFHDLCSAFPEYSHEMEDIIQFLLETNLILLQEGRFVLGSQKTFVDRKSFFFKNHHQNWRFKSIQQAQIAEQQDILFSAPFTVSQKGYEHLQSKFRQTIQEVSTDIYNFGDPEILACFNLDFFMLPVHKNKKT